MAGTASLDHGVLWKATPFQVAPTNRDVKAPRHLGQHLVHHDPDRPQRMILPHPCFRRQVTEYLTLLLVRSSHAFSYHTRIRIEIHTTTKPDGIFRDESSKLRRVVSGAIKV